VNFRQIIDRCKLKPICCYLPSDKQIELNLQITFTDSIRKVSLSKIHTDASESIQTTSFFGITFLCVDIFPPHTQIVTGDLPLFVHQLDEEK
jgi:hypothetical protein